MARHRSGGRGFTLVELLISISILSVVMLTAFAAIKMVGDALAAETLDNLVYSAVERVVGAIAEDLHYADISLVSTDGTMINFQVPMDLNTDGTVSAGELGFDLGGMPVNGSVTYRFVMTAAISVDLNEDGVSEDFDLGHMVKLMLNADTGQTITQRMGNWIIQPTGNWGGDIGGDGNPDPIFSQSGDRTTISLWSLGVDPRVAPRLANSRSAVYGINE